MKNKDKNRRIKVNCDYCGKEFYKYLSLIKRTKNNFCGRHCFNIWYRRGNASNWRGGKIKTFCVLCGKEFYRTQSRITRNKNSFCSKRCANKWQSINMVGEKSPLYKNGNRKTNCAWCGKELNIEQAKIKRSKNNFCNPKCHGQWDSVNKIGKNHPNWRGGIACAPYCADWESKDFKNYIFERDNFQCQNPTCNSDSDRLCRHHINYIKTDCDLSNIITLCIPCNSIANYDRKWHEAYYNEIMRRKMECII